MDGVEQPTKGRWQERLTPVAGLAVVLAALALFLTRFSSNVFQTSLFMVLAACVIVSFKLLPSGSAVGPFSSFWKAVNGVSLFYLLCLIAISFKTREETIEVIVTHIDPSLRLMNYDEVSYAQDCRMVNHELPNPYAALYHACFDMFAVAHFLGWFMKTLICRDLKLILFASVSFEVIEYSLRNVLNNFKECWWDHVIIDILGCNLLGIACAFVVIDKFGLDRYRWSLRMAPLQYSHWQNFRRFWTSWDVSGLQTKAFGSLRPYLKVVGLLVAFQLNDLTLFFLKYIYHIPPPHFLCLARLWVVSLLTVNAVKEYYDFMRFRAKFRKVTLLLFVSIISMEIFITLTHGKNEFGHAYIDNTGMFFLGGLFAVFMVFFVKIAISDVLRKAKVYRNAKVEKNEFLQTESAKLIPVDESELEIAKE